MAAGKGTRMRSRTNKVLHEVAGVPMIERVVRAALDAGVRRVVVVLGHQSEEVQAHLRRVFAEGEGAHITWAIQAEQLGTAHAAQCALPALEGFEGRVWILSGDTPLIHAGLFARLNAACPHAALAVAGMRLHDPASYGRLLTDARGLYAIREARDCAPHERAVRDVNAGLYRVDAALLRAGLATLKRENAQGEYYLTDLVSYARALQDAAGASGEEAGAGVGCCVFEGDDVEALEGVNDRVDLARAEASAQRQLALAAMRGGATLLRPETVRLSAHAALGEDALVEEDVTLVGRVAVGRGARLGRGCRLEGCVVGEGAVVGQGALLKGVTLAAGAVVHPYSHLEGAEVGAGAEVGPFARLREGTRLAARVKIGNFVETKKATFGEGAKASHLSYLGDVDVGARANVGAGTITCNYDGYRKHHTHIGEGAFIGSDTQLVAPVAVGAGAFVAAGSTVTRDVPPDALALSRAPQVEREGWAARFHAERRAAKP
ncbi:MAG: bifunctional N-acetylglucosamine-1-phosphate uridyltransferase/glucosamine-1-phosphate acetyltransferase [Deltaproteobacteria bacterium]|jgi:bifunctional UDP-N-acetylglucosamine pyrophosphorylase/glucosamine-1-phosphate N-acetyltransferase|nr:bifunctional N-acetylglucosamine-1-phosphate uridyltransferase/glucosamine-1-phosphate acetyltransferase [Deltaproteobacteria bacterium]